MKRFDLRVAGIVVLVVIVGLIAWSQSGGQDSPDHRSDNDGRQGTSALRQYAAALGHPTSALTTRPVPTGATSLLFVFTPSLPVGVDSAAELDSFVRGGGVLVYAAERGDPDLDRAFDIVRRPFVTAPDLTATPGTLDGVRSVRGTGGPTAFLPASDQVVVLRAAGGRVAGLEERRGMGIVIALTDPGPLTNGGLTRADNGRLAADLISLAGTGAGVAFDEYHHQPPVQGPESPLTGWISTPWGAAIAWAVLAAFVALLLRGTAFGPRRALPGGGHRSALEHVTAVGGLLRRSGATEATVHQLDIATRRALGRRYGIAGGPGFERALEARAPSAALALADAERTVRGARGERGLLDAARRLHRLAHPETTPTSTSQEDT